MSILNIEIKARCDEPDRIRQILKDYGADFKGEDHQIDTYFKVESGRLKLRDGDIENNLIFYRRSDTAGPKPSEINLVSVDQPSKLKTVLTNALGIKVTVDKRREIYFIGNVKFHIDKVKELGNFVEIEAIDKDGTIGADKLRKKCQYYLDLFAIKEEKLIARSYSDMLLDSLS